MSHLRALLLLSVVFLVSGCTTYVSVQPSPDETVTYYGGRPIVTSELSNSTVIISPGQSVMEKNKRLGFYVSFRNDSGESIEVDAHHVSAASPSDGSLRVYTYNEIIAEIKRQAMWASIASGMQAASESYSAANSAYSTTSTTGTYSGSGTYNAYGSYGSTYGSYNSSGVYSGTSTTYDPSKAAAAQAEANRNSQMRMAAIAERQASDMDMAESVLRRTTLAPGMTYEALLVIDAPSALPSKLELAFKVGEELHAIDFDYSPAKL